MKRKKKTKFDTKTTKFLDELVEQKSQEYYAVAGHIEGIYGLVSCGTRTVVNLYAIFNLLSLICPCFASKQERVFV